MSGDLTCWTQITMWQELSEEWRLLWWRNWTFPLCKIPTDTALLRSFAVTSWPVQSEKLCLRHVVSLEEPLPGPTGVVQKQKSKAASTHKTKISYSWCGLSDLLPLPCLPCSSFSVQQLLQLPVIILSSIEISCRLVDYSMGLLVLSAAKQFQATDRK